MGWVFLLWILREKWTAVPMSKGYRRNALQIWVFISSHRMLHTQSSWEIACFCSHFKENAFHFSGYICFQRRFQWKEMHCCPGDGTSEIIVMIWSKSQYFQKCVTSTQVWPCLLLPVNKIHKYSTSACEFWKTLDKKATFQARQLALKSKIFLH